MPDLKTNVLYYGDNLEILRGHIPDGSVDLIYLYPPFNSQQQYNVLFREPTGQGSTAQIRVFTELPSRVDTFARAPRLDRGGRQMAMSEPDDG